jgi:CelD/BcsL family acetyltransferase involved in cellulose biosynthesis
VTVAASGGGDEIVELPPYRFSLRPLDRVPNLAEEWRALEERAKPSFFQSWGWIGTWLDTIRSQGVSRVLVLAAHREGQLAGLGLLVPGRQVRHGFVRSRALALNETGNAALDTLCIEHNGLLAAAADQDALHAALVPVLERLADGWTELLLGGIAARAARAAARGGLACHVRAVQPLYVRELAETGFGRTTRAHIARARRDYGQLGEIVCEAAKTPEEAAAFFSKLKRLHQDAWAKRGAPGAFAAPFFEIFHRALIAGRLAAGEIQLLRIGAGPRDVGYLYNFYYRGCVYNYQSGFDYDLLPKGQPGLLCHALAVELNRARGARRYDLLAGDNQLKRQLADPVEKLFWLALQRDAPQLRIESTMRRVRRMFSRSAGAAASGRLTE